MPDTNTSSTAEPKPWEMSFAPATPAAPSPAPSGEAKPWEMNFAKPDVGMFDDAVAGVKSTLHKAMGAWDQSAVNLSKAMPEWMPGRMAPEEEKFYGDRATHSFEHAEKNAPQGTTGKVAAGLTYLPFGLAGPELPAMMMGGSDYYDEKQRLLKAGVDEETAQKGSLGTGLTSVAMGLANPGHVDLSGLKPFVATAVKSGAKAMGIGAVKSVADDAMTHQALTEGGYTEQAKDYQPTTEKALDAGVFNAAFHVGMAGAHHAAGRVAQKVFTPSNSEVAAAGVTPVVAPIPEAPTSVAAQMEAIRPIGPRKAPVDAAPHPVDIPVPEPVDVPAPAPVELPVQSPVEAPAAPPVPHPVAPDVHEAPPTAETVHSAPEPLKIEPTVEEARPVEKVAPEPATRAPEPLPHIEPERTAVPEEVAPAAIHPELAPAAEEAHVDAPPGAPFDASRPFVSKTEANLFREHSGLAATAVEDGAGGWLLKPTDRAINAENIKASSDAVRHLNDALEAHGEDPVTPVPAPSIPGFGVTQHIARVFGIEVHAVSGNGSFDGVAIGRHAFITEKTRQPVLAIVGHEAAHVLKNVAPELHTKLSNVITKYLHIKVVEGRRDFENERAAAAHKAAVANADASGLERPTAPKKMLLGGAKDEVVSDLNGAMWMDPKFWSEMRSLDPSLFRKVSYLFMEHATKVVNKFRANRFDASGMVKDVEAVRTAIAQTWTKHLMQGDIARHEQATNTGPARETTRTDENGKTSTTFDELEDLPFSRKHGDDERAAAQGVAHPADSSVREPVGGYNDPYENATLRPGTTDAQLAAGRDAVADLSRRIGATRFAGMVGDVHTTGTVLGSRLLANFKAGKSNQLVGQVAKTPRDLAALAQVYRDPRFETFRVIYMKGDEIAGEAGYTSRLPGIVSVPEGVLHNIVDDHARFGADGYYLEHNHPSGHSDPSPADVKLTQHLDTLLPGFLGHIVIDHNEYSVIKKDGTYEVIKDSSLNGVDFSARPEIEHALLGVKLSSPAEVAGLAKNLQIEKGHATLALLRNGDHTTQLLVDIPMGALTDVTPGGILKTKALVRRMARDSGSGSHRFVVLPDGVDLAPFKEMVKQGIFTDVISADGGSLRMTGLDHPGDFMGENPKTVMTSEEATQPVDGADRARGIVRGLGSLSDAELREVGLSDQQIYHARGLAAHADPKPASEASTAVTEQGAVEVDPVSSRRATEATPEFKSWFGDSKMVDEAGRPQVMYHGTAQDFNTFRPKQADAIFLTHSPELADQFTGLSEEWMAKNDQGDKAGRNVMPVYVKAENPFDYENPGHLAALEKAQIKAKPGDRELPDDIHDEIRTGDWEAIEHPAVQRAIRELGHDSFFSNESDGNKNIGVYQPEQVKSATGNNGSFDAKNGDIRFSRAETEDAPAPAAPIERKPYAGPGAKMLSAAKGLIGDLMHETYMGVSPMSLGSDVARAAAKAFANAERESRWQWQKFDDMLKENFTDAQRKKMWEAGDEQNVLMQEGRPTKGKGLDRLTPEERESMEKLHEYGNDLLQRAIDAGMYKDKGLPFWTPRLAAMIDAEGNVFDAPREDLVEAKDAQGQNIVTDSSHLDHRYHLTTEAYEKALKERKGDDALVVRDIRTMPLAMARLEKAIAGRELVNQIKKMTDSLGFSAFSDVEGPRYFTLNHPMLKTMQPMMVRDKNGDLVLGENKQPQVAKTAEGQPLFESKAIYISKDFEGPLKAIMSQKPGKVYSGVMALKGKVMGLIMYSPLIHNMVEFGRALPVMPGKVATLQVYFEGNKAKKDPVMMREAIRNGLVPIGHDGARQDITGLLTDPSLTPGRSLTAKALGGAVGMVNKNAGEAVKRGVDVAGQFWHQTLLWDRIGDLQMGLYKGAFERYVGEFQKKGMSIDDAQSSAGRLAAHLANRFSGALPNEAMSAEARKLANLVLFSRSFTLGNMGAMKDAITGLPKDIQSQIKMDAGELALKVTRDAARRKAIASFVLDIGLMYVGNTVLQNAFDHFKRDQSWDEIEQGYIDRFHEKLQAVKESPVSLLNPFEDIESLLPMHDNERGKENRIHFDKADEHGTQSYLRLPLGKVGEEFKGWLTQPLETLKAKLSTFARPMVETYNNDKGFGRRVYDPDAGALRIMGRIATNFLSEQAPVDQVVALNDWVHGTANQSDKFKVIGPLAGFSTSNGAPGGPIVGEIYRGTKKHDGEVADIMVEVKHMLKNGQQEQAIEMMREAHMDPHEIRSVIKKQAAPDSRITQIGLKKLIEHASPEDLERIQKILQGK